MFKKTLLLVTLLSLIIAPAAYAQSNISFSKVLVELWPEFDRPNMLAMYSITLAQNVSLPTVVRIRIPAGASVNAVAVCQANTGCFDTEYTQETQTGWNAVVIQATLPDLRVEFYDPSLDTTIVDRRYTYRWPGDYAAGEFKIEVQQPTDATRMQIKPGTFSPLKDEQGLTIYSLDAGALNSGQTLEIEIGYHKETDTLSSSAMSVEPIEPLEEVNSGPYSLTSALPVVLGLVGVALIVGGGLWYWRSGLQPSESRGERRKRRRSAVKVPQAGPGEYIYCVQCGKRATAGDRFCRACGAELRN